MNFHLQLGSLALILCWSFSSYAISRLPKQSLEFWHNKVSRYPELAEPRIILGWFYFDQAKTSGTPNALKHSCQQLTVALNLQPTKNGVKLAISLASYQHDFVLMNKLAEYYLSYWRYDNQVLLWRLQGAIAQKQDKLIYELWDQLKALPGDLYTMVADADVSGYKQNFNRRILSLKQALVLAGDARTQAWLWLQVAVVYLDEYNDLVQADHALTKAETFSPDNADIQRHRIEWLILNRQYSAAEVKLTQISQWHHHPELKQFKAMIDVKTINSEMYHSQLKSTICNQALNQFLLQQN